MSYLSDIGGTAGAGQLFDLQAVDVVYRDAADNETELAAVLTTVRIVERGDASGRRRKVWTREALVSRDPDHARGGLAEISLAATLVCDGETWAIASALKLDAQLWRLTLEQSQITDQTRPGFRRAA